MFAASVESVKSPLRIVLFLLGLAAGCTCGRTTSENQPKPRPDTATTQSMPSTLVGVVKDSQGEALPDVLVLAWPTARKSEEAVQSRTDEAGRFVLPKLRPGKWTLLLESPGLGTLEVERQLPEESLVELTFEGTTRTISGVVVDHRNQPQVGAVITLGGLGLRWTREARSDASGIFQFRGLGFGKFAVRAVLDTSASPTQPVLIEEATLRTSHARLILAPGAYLQGVVEDEQGRPLPSARVEVVKVPSDDLSSTIKGDPSGHFSFGPFAPGRYQLTARLEDYVLLDAPEVSVPTLAATLHHVKMVKAAQVHGRLLDETAHPLPGITVTVLSLIAGKDELTVVPGALPLAAEAAAMPVGRLMRPGGVRTAESDRNGEFNVVGLSPGRARLQGLPKDRLPLRRDPLLLVPGEVHEVGELVSYQGVLLGGSVALPGATSLESIVVEAKLLARGSREVISVSTDPKGRFSIRVPTGRYAVSARNALYQTPQPLEIDAAAGKDMDSLLLPLTAPIANSRH